MELQASVVIITCLSVIVFEAISGIIASVYVVVIVLFEFNQRKNMRTGNKIRVALSISNMIFSFVTTAGVFSGFFWSGTLKNTSSTSILYSLLMYTIGSCSWLSAGLSFFYFIKIVSFHSALFLWMKMKIRSIVSWIILVSEAVSLGSFLVVLLIDVPPGSSNSTSMVLSNDTSSGNTEKMRFAYMVIIVTLVPLLTVLITSICTIVVLIKHKRKMEKNMGGAGNVQLTVYQNAARRMLRLLFFFVVFHIFTLVFYMSGFSELSPGFWFCIMILSSFTAVQSVLFVLGNHKLKGAWRELFHCMKGGNDST